MKKLTFIIVMLLLAVVSMPGCERKISNKIPENFDYGTWSGSTYRNDFFGFTFTTPEDWYLEGKVDVKSMLEEAEDMDFTNKEEMKKLNKIAEVTSAMLFFVLRYSNEEAIEKEAFNPNINLTVENISVSGMKINQTQYIKAVRQNLSKVVPDLIFKSQTNKMIGGQEFTSLLVQYNIEGIPISAEQLICLKNGYAMLFCLTWIDDSEKQQLDDIMATLKWD